MGTSVKQNQEEMKRVKPINTSLFDFPTLIENGFVYVDKTAQIYELAKPTADYIYFFPRPRRFGKSLLLSTLNALFRGRRELFRGLAIDSMPWNWEKEVYPVLHLDMSTVISDKAETLEQNLNNVMRRKCGEFGVQFYPRLSAAANFDNLLTALKEKSEKRKFVLLIDEYDSPVAGLLDDEEKRTQLDKIRRVLHDFYVKAKANCGNIRFMMVTGVSKFAKTSIFSAFNNPRDLSMDRRTAAILGYTHEEMERYFHEHIQAFADERSESYEAAFGELLAWYDSYQFCPEHLVKVVNPVSLGRALQDRTLRNYWEATAGSTLIYDALKDKGVAPVDMAAEVSVTTLEAPDALAAPAVALLYQGGYLTIDRRTEDGFVQLRIPNREVEDSMQRGYMAAVLGRDFEVDNFQKSARTAARKIAEEGVTDSFRTMLRQAYALLPHDWVCRDEKEAKRHFIAFMVFARARVAGEPQHATGRPDAVLETARGVYIFEFKYDATAAAALEQCRRRNYAGRYAGQKLPVFYVGVNYNPAGNIRTIDEVGVEQAL